MLVCKANGKVYGEGWRVTCGTASAAAEGFLGVGVGELGRQGLAGPGLQPGLSRSVQSQ